MRVGQHVVARDALGELRRAIVMRVPRSERDWTHSHVKTSRSRFPRVWLVFPDRVDTAAVPWPLKDVITDAGDLP